MIRKHYNTVTNKKSLLSVSLMAIGIEKHSGHNLETTALVIKENTQRKKTHTNTLFLLGRKSPSPRQHPQTKKKNIHSHQITTTTKTKLPKWFIPNHSSSCAPTMSDPTGHLSNTTTTTTTLFLLWK